MEFIYSHPEQYKIKKLYRRLCIIHNKIAELNDRRNPYNIKSFVLDNGIKMTLRPIVVKEWFKIERNIMCLTIQDKNDNLLFSLLVGKNKKTITIKSSNLYIKEPEMFAIYIEQLETQVNEMLEKVNKTCNSDYMFKMAESLFE